MLLNSLRCLSLHLLGVSKDSDKLNKIIESVREWLPICESKSAFRTFLIGTKVTRLTIMYLKVTRALSDCLLAIPKAQHISNFPIGC